ncbi:MAG: pyridoxal-phosphate dependent enzyme [Gemmatimonadales bacterium]|nr:MAG: pyridoxal-phosphate dependent enzyme [Gemmatimonadales bacterium]
MKTISLHARAPELRAAPTRYGNVLETVGNTPLVELTGFLPQGGCRLFLKLEAANPGGSAKDRPAAAMIAEAVRSGRLRRGSVVVESSSGNMGIGLAQACAWYGLRFICVVDARAQPGTLATMRALGAEIDMVSVPEGSATSALAARLDRVAHLVTTLDGAYWPNQYANALNPVSHAMGTMAEIDEALEGQVDGVFVGVGTTGTLGGCLDFVAANARPTRVTAVDAVGSILFGGEAGERRIPGMGAARVPPLAKRRWGGTAASPRVLRVTDLDCVVGCRRLARTDALLVGGSAGGVLQAVRTCHRSLPPGQYVAVAADSGHRYLDTVFDDAWVEEVLGCPPERLARLVGHTTVSRL